MAPSKIPGALPFAVLPVLIGRRHSDWNLDDHCDGSPSGHLKGLELVPIIVVMVHEPRSTSSRLSLVILLLSGSLLLAGAIGATVSSISPWSFVVMLALSTVLTTCATWKESRRLFTQPTLNLAQTVRSVLISQDFSVRAAGRSQGEVRILADALNELLERMDERDRHYKGEGDRLEAEVAARTSDLRETNRRLETATQDAIAANRAQSRFIANMTHEIRTPMNGVLGMAELLFNTDLTPQQQKFTRTVLASAEDLLSIINNILDFSKVEAGKLEKIDNQPFNPKECVDKVSELLVSRAKPKGVALSHEYADDVPKAMLGDGKRVRQVLTNIIGNAIKFTDHGTIVVRTSLVETVDETSTIRFEVVDTGVGIPSHLHQHVFEGFSQADTSTTRQFGGTGLGLAISKHLVELLGGEIGVISRPGVGSNFWFTIPGQLWRTATAADRDLEGVRALLIGTTHASRDALRHQLTTFGATCTTVPTAEKAIWELGGSPGGQSPFDVALIDTQALDWYALAREIRASETTRSLPLVLVSTVRRSDAELRDAGIDGCLTQPVQESELFACLARVTGRLDISVGTADEQLLETDVWGSAKQSAGDAEDPQRAALSARVLVAEDNLVNREVAVAMLETLECSVDVVDDGLQAVEAAQRQSYDVVFLDCQMPNLDGYGAARQIRELEEQDRVPSDGTEWPSGRLPIVALTAHTAPADRARSLESGMDDYVSKPFALKTLREVLEKWVVHVERAESSVPPPCVPASRDAENEDPINEAALAEIIELDRQTGGGVFARVVRSYLDTTPVTLEQLRVAVGQGDAAGIARAAHDLKSASFNVGAETLATVSKSLEVLGRNGTTGGAAAMATQLDQLYVAVKTSLEARLEKSHRDTVLSTSA